MIASVEPEELAFAGAARHAQLIRDGTVSSHELVDVLLARIERLDPGLNAFRVVLAEEARREADAVRPGDGGLRRPLLGVPVAVKDNLDVRGQVTAHGTGAVSTTAEADAPVVARLRDAGAIVLGKTNLPELSLWALTESATWGATRNPVNPAWTPGGSSGGSAAAVAAGLVGATHGADGGGSIRLPAACCGLVGLKLRRRQPAAETWRDWHGLGTDGALARTVADAALLADALVGGGSALVAAAGEAPRTLRVAVGASPPLPVRPHPVVLAALEDTAARLSRLGHRVERRDDLFGDSRHARAVGSAVSARVFDGVSDHVARLDHPQRLEARTRRLAALGRLPGRARRLRRADATEAREDERLRALLREVDVLLLPIATRPPLPVGAWQGGGALRTLARQARFIPYTSPWNLAGRPAIAVPAGRTSEGHPLGVQLIAGDEATLVSLAAQLEADGRL